MLELVCNFLTVLRRHQTPTDGHAHTLYETNTKLTFYTGYVMKLGAGVVAGTVIFIRYVKHSPKDLHTAKVTYSLLLTHLNVPI